MGLTVLVKIHFLCLLPSKPDLHRLFELCRTRCSSLTRNLYTCLLDNLGSRYNVIPSQIGKTFACYVQLAPHVAELPESLLERYSLIRCESPPQAPPSSMKFALFTKLALLTTATGVLGNTVAYDRAYDGSNASLTSVACSDGPHGLIVRGYTTFGSLPNFPFIGGAEAVEGYDSANCGSCWNITYTNPAGRNKTISMLAIDGTARGFVLGLRAADILTGGQAVHLGRVNATTKRVPVAVCGL